MTEPYKGTYLEIPVLSFDEFETQFASLRKDCNYTQAAFRGQSDYNWGLVPTIFRDAVNRDDLNWDYFLEKVFGEFSNVKEFIKIADSIGIPLPGDLHVLLNNRDNWKDFQRNVELRDGWFNTVDNQYKELITLAQHHGVGTRFLDFSFDPYIALYFAAEGAFTKIQYPKGRKGILKNHFSLWGIDRKYLNDKKCPIRYFEVPTARNRYLNAQSGLFLYFDLPTGSRGIDGSDVDIKELIMKKGFYNAGYRNIWPVIFKFIFPYELSPEVLSELDRRYKVNLTTIKPNLDNIVIQRRFKDKVNNLLSELRASKEKSK